MKSGQGGYVAMLLLASLITGLLFLFVGSLNLSPNFLVRAESTAAALREAKDALIGRAVADQSQPGGLPCPDTSNTGTGIADMFVGQDCKSYLGRLPWRTLGLPDLRDASGEQLWYALSPNFRDHPKAQPINSRTIGSLQVYAADGVTPIAQNAAAVVFSPGTAVSGQSRDASQSAACPGLGNVVQTRCPANYLDAAANLNNATVGSQSNSSPGPFIAGARSGTFDDQLLVINPRDIFPLVEQRVARDFRAWLTQYRRNNGYYPYPAKFDSCTSGSCPGDSSVCRGRVPSSPAPAVGSLPPFSGDAAFTGLPAYFKNNEWYLEMYYSVGSGSLQNPPYPLAQPCNSRLTVNGIVGSDVVFFTPGTRIGNIQVWPSNLLSDYLVDLANQDGWGTIPGTIPDDLYTVPSSRQFDRNRIYQLP